MGEIGENDPEHEKCQMLGVLGVCHFDQHVAFASANQSLFCGGGWRGEERPFENCSEIESSSSSQKMDVW